MSIQDDVFDVAAALEGKPERQAFARVVERLARVESDRDDAARYRSAFRNISDLIVGSGSRKGRSS